MNNPSYVDTHTVKISDERYHSISSDYHMWYCVVGLQVHKVKEGK